MFGKKNRTHEVRLTEKEIKVLERTMSKSELKEFRKRQERAKDDRMWDALLMSEFLDE